MLVLQLLLIGILSWGAVHVMMLFDHRTAERFGYRFLTLRNFGALSAAGGLLVAGHLWREAAAEAGGDTLNGIMLMALGGVGAAAIAYKNLQRTNLLFGSVGTALQLGLVPLVMQLGVTVAVVWFFLAILASVRPVYVVN